MVLPSAESLTRYQVSLTAAPATDTVTRAQVEPASVERKMSPVCATATSTRPSLELSTHRHQWFTWPSGKVALRQLAPPSLLSRRLPFWMTAAMCWPSCEVATASQLALPGAAGMRLHVVPKSRDAYRPPPYSSA